MGAIKYSWCSPPDTALARTATPSRNRCRDLGSRFCCVAAGGSGTPGASAICGPPALWWKIHDFRIGRGGDSDNGMSQSKHSWRMVPMTRSQIALAGGQRGGDGDKEIAGNDRLAVKAQKCRPAQVTARSAHRTRRQVLSHCARRHANARLHEEFLGNAFLAPQRILVRDPTNQRLDLGFGGQLHQNPYDPRYRSIVP